MKHFLTKNEACEVLNKLQTSQTITYEDSVSVASIKVCLAAELGGFNLWGAPIEEVRPLFRECEKPTDETNEMILRNFETYKLCIEDIKNKFLINAEVHNG